MITRVLPRSVILVCTLVLSLAPSAEGVPSPRSAAGGVHDIVPVGPTTEAPNITLGAVEWEPLRQAINSFDLVPDCAVSVARDDEQLFEHEKGTTTMTTTMPIASATKWVSGVTVMNIVQRPEFGLGLDDFAYQHLDFWTRDPEDARSTITLRHFLGFTSGYTCSTGCAGATSMIECMRQIYATCSLTHPPGTLCDYQEIHLQFAGAIAESATSRPFLGLVQEFIMQPLAMTATTWNSQTVPLLGSGITTNAVDYGAFLRGYASGRILAPELRAEMERIQYADAELGVLALVYGRYSLGNWYECVANLGVISEECIAADVHTSPGIFGYTPVTDRVLGYNFQIAYLGLPGVGTTIGVAMRLAIKPVMDAIIRGGQPDQATMALALNTTHWKHWVLEHQHQV